MLDDPLPFLPLVERYFGKRTGVVLRWVLFLPVGLFSGILLFAVFAFIGPHVDDPEVASLAGLAGAIFAGPISVAIAVKVAPRYPKFVATVTAIASVSLALILVFWTWASRESGLLIAGMIVGSVYSLGAVVAAITACRDEAG